MIAIFISPIYILLNIYILIRFIGFLKAVSDIFKNKILQIFIWIFYFLIALTPLWSFLLPNNTGIKRVVNLIANYWIGIQIYTILIVAIGQLLSIILRAFKILPKDFFKRKKPRIISGVVSMLLIACVCIYGMLHAKEIKITNYDVEIQNEALSGQELKIALIADLHMGYSIGTEHIEKMVNLINKQNADIVCMPGDIFDNDYDALDNPQALTKALKNIKSKYGTFATWGNHDVSQKLLAGFTTNFNETLYHDERMIQFLNDSNIKTLVDESVLINDEFYIVGRNDEKKPVSPDGRIKSADELLSDLDKNKPSIVMYHEPDDFDNLSNAGCDLLLSGHTHNGQMFPGNLTIGLLWDNAYGYKEYNGMQSITTSGVGVWGANMRVATDNEIAVINVKFV